MVATAIPGFLYEDWFWLAILLGLFILLRFAKRRGRYPPPFPRIAAFLTRHQKHIVRATDLFIVVSVVLFGGFLLSFLVTDMVKALSAPLPVRATRLQYTWLGGLGAMIFWSGMAALLIGLLSPFHSNLTRRKRVFLLLLCLLPVALTALALATASADVRWSMIQLGAAACSPGWIVNAPPILVGQHCIDFGRRILCKLHLVSSDLSS